MSCYLENKNKEDCCGCEACAQICPVKAIEMKCDDEKFKYPHIIPRFCPSYVFTLVFLPKGTLNSPFLLYLNIDP